jgi:hypothetical protein
MTDATATSRTFAFTDHLPLTPYHCLFAFTDPLPLTLYHCLFAFTTSRALSESLTSTF